MKLFSDGWTGMLRKQLTGHTNEKGRQIRIDTVGGKTIWLTNRVYILLSLKPTFSTKLHNAIKDCCSAK